MNARVARRPRAAQNDFVTRPMLFNGAFDEAFCDRTIELALSRRGVEHSLDYGEPDSRRAVSHWIHRDRQSDWLFERIAQTFMQVNRWFRFDLDRMREPLLVARYGKGPGFTWHVDALEGISSSRKISASVQLSDHAAYGGGNLEFIPDGSLQLSRLRGSLIAFPSYCAHRVTPITRGERFALIAWIHGPAYR